VQEWDTGRGRSVLFALRVVMRLKSPPTSSVDYEILVTVLLGIAVATCLTFVR
jgi:hypothetical protein